MRRAGLALALLTAVAALAASGPGSPSSNLSWSQQVAWSPDGQWIAVGGLTDYGGGVVAARADGSGAKALAIGGYRSGWSPDGRRIADASGYSMVVATVSDGTYNTITPPPQYVDSFDWSPDSEQVVYEREGGLFESRWDGTEQRPLTGGGDPAWSPDGREIAFERRPRECQSEIAIVGADGSGERTLASGGGRAQPVWSPDGNLLAYRGVCSDAIFVINRDGSGERILGHVGGFYGNPVAWSSDGRWVGAHGLYQGTTTLFQVDGAAQVTFQTGQRGAVSWSPRDDRILFSRQTAGGDTLFVGSTDGSEREIGPGSSADWSPNGTKIAVVRPIDFEHVRFSSCAEQVEIVDLSGRVLYGVTPCGHNGTRGADLIVGTPGPDYAFGRDGADRIFGGLGDDRLFGGNGADRLYGGAGRDRIEAGAGADRIGVSDGAPDRVSCGPGRDVVWADSLDSVARNCESVVRR
jgi:Tol biopolymer transport system component